MRLCARARVHACVRVCARVCVCARACVCLCLCVCLCGGGGQPRGIGVVLSLAVDGRRNVLAQR